MRIVWNDQGPGVVWENNDTGWNGYEPGHVDKGFPLARPHITRTRGDHDPQPWCVWVPYLRPEHFDAPFPSDFGQWEDIVKNASVHGPWGDTFWDTHAEAMEFLDTVLRTDRRACPHCGSTTPGEHNLGPEFLVCGECSEILYPYELKEVLE